MSQEYMSPTITSVMLVLVEAGAIYTAAVFIILCTYVTSNNATYILAGCVSAYMIVHRAPSLRHGVDYTDYSEFQVICNVRQDQLTMY